MNIKLLLSKFINDNKRNKLSNQEIYWSSAKLNPIISYFKNTKKIITVRLDCEYDFSRFVSNINDTNKFINTVIIVDDDFNPSRYILIQGVWTQIWCSGDKGQNNDEFEVELIKSLSKSDEVVIGYYNDYIKKQ